MFALVDDIEAYPRRFDWCEAASVLQRDADRVLARLDVRVGGFATWFVTENRLHVPHHIDMRLSEGPFRKLEGRWTFHALDEAACKVSLMLDFEPSSRLLLPAVQLGMGRLADRMVDDFVRVADSGG